MLPVPASRHSLYETALLPAGHRAREGGLEQQGPNFTPYLGLRPAVRHVGRRGNAATTPGQTSEQPPRGLPTQTLPGTKPEPPPPASRTPPFATMQFHVLLNSLFKVLFNFPSRYLFAIGLEVIFSLTWSLPRTLSCTPKQLDSGEEASDPETAVLRAYHPLWAVAPVKVDFDWPSRTEEALPHTTFRTTKTAGGSVLGSARFIRHY